MDPFGLCHSCPPPYTLGIFDCRSLSLTFRHIRSRLGTRTRKRIRIRCHDIRNWLHLKIEKGVQQQQSKLKSKCRREKRNLKSSRCRRRGKWSGVCRGIKSSFWFAVKKRKKNKTSEGSWGGEGGRRQHWTLQ